MRNKAIDLRFTLNKIIQKTIRKISSEKILLSHVTRKGNYLSISDIENSTSKFNIQYYDKILILGAGKASSGLVSELIKLFPDKKNSGLIVTKDQIKNYNKNIEILIAGHPIPDFRGIKAARKIFSIIKNADEKKLIIFILSGGSSALLPMPINGFSFEEKIKITRDLILAGADIEEINCFRKYFSKIKGGGFLNYSKTKIITLIISDVIGNSLSVIGSAPTYLSKPNNQKVAGILIKYNLYNKLSMKAKRKLEKNIWEKYQPKNRAENFILFDNRCFQKEIAAVAIKNKIKVYLLKDFIQGEVRFAARKLISEYRTIIKSVKAQKGIYLILSGGETTVNVKGNGIGGRNHELSLLMLDFVSQLNNAAFLSLATDGDDGNSANSGAIIDSNSKLSIKKQKLDYKKFLDSNDSYSLFKLTGELFSFPKRRTNVMDIQFFIFEID